MDPEPRHRGARQSDAEVLPEYELGGVGVRPTEPQLPLAANLSQRDKQPQVSVPPPANGAQSSLHVEQHDFAATYRSATTRPRMQRPQLRGVVPAHARNAAGDPQPVEQTTPNIRPRSTLLSSPETRTSAVNQQPAERRVRKTRLNQWPTLLPRHRERESGNDTFYMQQRQAILRREQSGGD